MPADPARVVLAARRAYLAELEQDVPTVADLVPISARIAELDRVLRILDDHSEGRYTAEDLNAAHRAGQRAEQAERAARLSVGLDHCTQGLVADKLAATYVARRAREAREG